MTTYFHYPAYRPSEVEWLGDLPNHWELRRLKFLANINAETLSETTQHDYRIQYIDIGNVSSEGVILETQEFDFENAPSRARRRARAGDTIISTVRTYLQAIAYLESPEPNRIVSTGFAVLHPRDFLYPKYLYYLVRSQGFVDAVMAHSTGVSYPAINPSILAGLWGCLPPVTEQCAIAAFLDHETAHIDALIAKKRELIYLLGKQRTSIISHAVTEGLNPDAPMKASGIEWLGDVPKHWNIVKVKRLVGHSKDVVQTGPFGAQLHAEDYVEQGVPLILIRNVKNNFIDDTNIPKVSHDDAVRLAMYRLNIGDVVFSRVGSIGRLALITEREQGWLISGQMLRLRINRDNLNRKYLMYALGSEPILQAVALESVGSTRESINTEILRNLEFPLPPISEQNAIVNRIEKETARIDDLNAHIEYSITLLQKKRTALISAAVIGKIDVRAQGQA